MADITRSEAAALLGEQKVSDIVQPAAETSAVLSTFRSVPLSKKVYRQSMLATLPTAGFVTESATDAAGVKPTTDMSWTDKTMTAEEIAVIVPIHENILDDADIDLWAEIRPRVAEAFALVLDRAVLYGVNAPASWTDANIIAKALAAGNNVTRGGTIDLAEDFNQIFARVEDDGFDVNTVLARKSLRSRLRGLRDSANQPIYLDNVRGDGATPTIYGERLAYIHKGLHAQSDIDGAGAGTPKDVEAIALDRNQYLVGIREDFTVKFLDQATVGGVNLAERDMVAMRFKFRVAFGSFVSPLQTAGGEYPASFLSAP